MMEEKERIEREGELPERAPAPRAPETAPETAREPVPGVEHEPEPDAANIIPAEDKPGTL